MTVLQNKCFYIMSWYGMHIHFFSISSGQNLTSSVDSEILISTVSQLNATRSTKREAF